MASSKVMGSSASRNSDLKRKLSAHAKDFLRLDSGGNARDSVVSDLTKNSYMERNSSSSDRGHGPVVEVESNSASSSNAEISLLDAVGAIAPINDGETVRLVAVRKTVDDVWREILAGKKSEPEPKPKQEMMTLEDFLAKAGAAEEDEGKGSIVAVKKETMLSGGIQSYESSPSVIEMGLGVGMDLGTGRGKRSMSLLEPLDKAAQQRQRRMIKNRESAARSRERKQAYQVELESMAVRLEEENERLLEEKAERTKKRLKQLMENVIPVIEKRRPPRLHKVRSMEW